GGPRRAPSSTFPWTSRRQCRRERRVEVAAEPGVVTVGSGRQCSYHKICSGRKRGEPVAHQVPQPAADLVPHDRRPDRPGNHETGARRSNGARRGGVGDEVDDEGTATGASTAADRGGEQPSPPQA